MHRTFAHTIFALLLAALLAGCGAAVATPPAATISPEPQDDAPTAVPPPAPTGPPAPTLGQPFPLRVGENATVGPVDVTLLGILDDSRCPTQVSCAWEGAATAELSVAVDGQDQGTLELTLNGQDRETDESRAAVAGYTVRLVQLAPYPQQPEPIPQADYTAQLVVERGAAAYTPVGDGSFDGVIVPEQDARAFDPRADGYWTPAEADVRALEAGLVQFLQAAAPERSPELWRKQASYKRQYAGLVRDGRRLVYASFFCDSGGEAWRHEPLFVMDGGDCFFQLTYDPARGTFDDLMVNGEA
jgi:hypothetical protein